MFWEEKVQRGLGSFLTVTAAFCRCWIKEGKKKAITGWVHGRRGYKIKTWQKRCRNHWLQTGSLQLNSAHRNILFYLYCINPQNVRKIASQYFRKRSVHIKIPVFNLFREIQKTGQRWSSVLHKQQLTELS